MSGTVISRRPAAHTCRVAQLLELITEAMTTGRFGLPSEMIGRNLVHDDSMNYRDGDVWECDSCHRRWTLQWPNDQPRNSGIIERGSVRVLPCWRDWVVESPRKWKKRMKCSPSSSAPKEP